MAESSWFYTNGGAEDGPIPEAELLDKLRSGTVSADTIVWRAGMGEWSPARSVPAFRDALAQHANADGNHERESASTMGVTEDFATRVRRTRFVAAAGILVVLAVVRLVNRPLLLLLAYWPLREYLSAQKLAANPARKVPSRSATLITITLGIAVLVTAILARGLIGRLR